MNGMCKGVVDGPKSPREDAENRKRRGMEVHISKLEV